MDGGSAHLHCVRVSQVGRAPVLCSLIHLCLPQPAQSDIHTHTHTYIWHILSQQNKASDSHNSINLKQAGTRKHRAMATKQIMLIGISKSLCGDKHSAESKRIMITVPRRSKSPLACFFKKVHAEETKLDILKKNIIIIFIHRSELCIKMCHRFGGKKCYVDLPVRWFRVLRK